jgi:hypothetical protein
MMALFRKHEVWFFLGLIVVANTLFVSGIVFEGLPHRLYSYGRFALLGGVLFGIILLARGPDGIRDLLRPMLVWRRSPLWYVFAIAWNPVLCVIVLSGIALLGHGTSPEIHTKFSVIGEPSTLRLLFISSLVGEIVWISYAIRRLSQDFTPYVSALIVGGVWTCWWLPMVFYGYGVIPGLPVGALLLNQVGIAAMCTFVYMHTRSGFIVLCLQLMANSSALIFPVNPVDGGLTVYWIFAICYFVAALLLFVIFGPKPLFGVPMPRGSQSRI